MANQQDAAAENPKCQNGNKEKRAGVGGGKAEAKKSKAKEFAPYGNYKHYYGYRLPNIEEDPRFKLFQEDWFYDKDCLDVGCNSGLITINIAKKFCCRSLLGIDIDEDRIREAWFNLKQEERHLKKGVAKDEKVANHDEQVERISLSAEQQKQKPLTDIVSFRSENFVDSRRPLPLEYYDTIVCLSVTKWIHLNWGDDGLLTFFAKIWRLLKPGGIFVVEPQPWKSYSSNRRASEKTSFHYKNIMLFPEDFQDILLDKIGFRYVEHVAPSVAGSVAGFNRPVLVFRK